jgi:hypothetical protein
VIGGWARASTDFAPPMSDTTSAVPREVTLLATPEGRFVFVNATHHLAMSMDPATHPAVIALVRATFAVVSDRCHNRPMEAVEGEVIRALVLERFCVTIKPYTPPPIATDGAGAGAGDEGR